MTLRRAITQSGKAVTQALGKTLRSGYSREPPAANLIELPTYKAAPLQGAGQRHDYGRDKPFEDEDDDENDDWEPQRPS